jgi:rod shape determining protein RodA
MQNNNFLQRLNSQRKHQRKSIWQFLHLDPQLLIALLLIITFGLIVLTSASNDSHAMIYAQGSRFVLAVVFMFVAAQIPPAQYRIWIPWIYAIGIVLLIVVLVIGHTGKGAQRWLGAGMFRFQPSELMKIAVPMMVAWFLGEKELPPRISSLFISALLILVPALLVAKQPDLGTALMIVFSGVGVVIFAGMSWRLIGFLLALVLLALPVLWFFMHSYQRSRVLTFLNPDRDPLGAGYHIIQSKIAIGSGGFFGKGWFNGTQSHLDFLPEHSTDFIFSVLGEEFGFLGALTLLILYLFVVGRAFRIAFAAYDSFTRLMAASLALTFFLSVFVNIGMVSGILPVVGLPLPLVSYGGTSIVTVLTGFGILMSIHTHKPMLKGQL